MTVGSVSFDIFVYLGLNLILQSLLNAYTLSDFFVRTKPPLKETKNLKELCYYWKVSLRNDFNWHIWKNNVFIYFCPTHSFILQRCFHLHCHFFTIKHRIPGVKIISKQLELTIFWGEGLVPATFSCYLITNILIIKNSVTWIEPPHTIDLLKQSHSMKYNFLLNVHPKNHKNIEDKVKVGLGILRFFTWD